MQPKCVRTSSKGKLTLNKKKKQPFAVFFRIGVLKNFAIFTEKHLCWSLFLINLLATLLKRDSNAGRYFPVNVAQFLRTAFFMEHLHARCFCESLIIFAEVWVRALSIIYDGAFCGNREKLPTIFIKNPISCVWQVPKYDSASKRFLQSICNI